ncbi:WG repeat-containing protein [Spirosoma linguale]|uniref:Serine/threonine protein kinase n=1 Tax=Spirosoma linguale (strain ATCC 33905 / DSM 74 / LMG 10896 / Claus 1) TaxID=504472 RepID=D2QJR9_SPILD|nr:serine/threonine protein kinase [Spirosoma linguale DSM 74]
MFPSISEYIQSIELATETLSRLNHLIPVRKADGQLYFSSGNFAVVFRMNDPQTGKQMALRCFLRDAAGRRDRIRAIGRYLTENPSGYLIPFTLYPNELWVDTRFGQEHEFDVVLMPWVDGQTLSQYVADCCRQQHTQKLEQLAHRFDELVRWLLNQPFAHGDLKADNILIRPDGQLVLIDYDGCFVPALAGQEATETGTLPYRHPARTPVHFDRNLDDFSLLALSLELHALSRSPALHMDTDTLLLTLELVQTPFQAAQWNLFRNLSSAKVSARAGLLEYAIHCLPGPIMGLMELLPTSKSVPGAVATPVAATPDTLIPYLQKKQWSFINQAGELVGPGEWESAGLFSDGLAPVRKQGKWGFCHLDGNLTIDCQFDEAREFKAGLAVVRQQGKYGFIDTEGQPKIPCIYDEAGNFVEGRAMVRQKALFGFIDEQGSLVIPPQFDSAGPFSEGLASVKMGGHYGFVDTTGTLRIPCELPLALTFSEGLSAVEKDGQYGFINAEGNLVIPPQFDMAGSFVDGLASVKRGRKIGFINQQGDLVIPCEFDEIVPNMVFPFSEGLALVRKGNLFGYINKQGQLVIPYQFTNADNFSEGLAAVQMGDQWGYIGQTGELIVPYAFSHAYRFHRGLALIRKNNRLVYIDRAGFVYSDQP